MEYASGILEASGQLLDTIDDVTELASLQLDPSLQENVSFDLAEIVQVTRRLLDKRAYEQGIELSVELPERALRLNRDVVQMRQIVFNMLSDAIQRARPGGRVVLAADAEGPAGLEIRTVETLPEPDEPDEPDVGAVVLDQIIAESLSLSFIRRMVAREGDSLEILRGEESGQIVTTCRFDGVLEELDPSAEDAPEPDQGVPDEQETASGSPG
jgi:signal transduction histidine kinase